MSLTREHRLNVLGLLPVWRRRDAAPVAALDAAVPIGAAQGSGVEAEWAALEAEVRTCTRCALHSLHRNAILGAGDRQADWLVVSEAPTIEEAAQGEPFVGQAGQLLDAMLAAIGLKRGEKVYITHILKSPPPANHDPTPDEIIACRPYLERQIALIQPRIILVLGRVAAQTLLGAETPVGRLRGQVHTCQGVPLVVTYHPAYLLQNPADKGGAWADLLLAQRQLKAPQ